MSGTIDAVAVAVGGATAGTVRWERLRLQGFGRHRDLTLRFPPGLGVWTAPNEAGKSTAALGLVATVWGLPHLQEPAGFTWGRLRAFDGGPHRGEATLQAGALRFTVQRAFDTHRVRVVRHGEHGDETVWEGDHNPNARREAEGYRDWLRATLGIDDAALVLATFVVAQGDLGGPPHRVEHDVQALVAGAGGGTAHEALARLDAAVRERTRQLRDLGPRWSRDGRSDQALEQAEARLRGLEARRERARAEADALAALRRAAEEGERAARAAAAEATRARAEADALAGWLARREAVLAALRRAGERERAATRARTLAAEAAEAASRAAAVHPGLAGVAGAGFEARVAAWSQALAAEATQQRRLAAARAARDEALRGAHDRVAAALAAEAAAPGAAPAADRPSEPAPGLAGWSAVHAAGRRWRAGHAAVTRERDLAAAAERELAALAPLADLDPQARADLRGHREAVAAWAARLTEVEAAWVAWRDRAAEAAERFGDVADLDAGAAADLLAFGRAWDAPDPWAPARGWGAAALAAVAVGALRAAGIDLAWALLAGAAAAGAWVWAWPRRPALARARHRLDARVAVGSRALAGDDERRRELARRREAFEARGPDLAELAAGERAAAARAAKVRAGAAAFYARWSPWRDALLALGHGEDLDLGDALARFERAAADHEAALARAAEAARALGVDEPAAFDPAAPAAGAGPDAQRVLGWARSRGALPASATVADLASWLGRVQPATWAAWRAAALAEDAAAARHTAARAARERAEADAVRVAREFERAVVAEEAALRSARASVVRARAAARAGLPERESDEDVAELGPDGLLAAWRARAEAQALAAAAAQRCAAHLEAIAAVDVDAATAAAERAAAEAGLALAAWRALVAEAAVDLPAADPAPDAPALTEADAAAARARAETAEATVARVQADAWQAREALARAEGGEPDDVAALDDEIAEARAEAARVRFEVEAFALAVRELTAAADVYRGGHARRLARAAGERFAAFTGVAGRRVRLDERLAAEVVEADGRVVAVAQLSQGARDQLALALRLAVADAVAGEVRLPLVLDDPFATWDDERAAAARATLAAIAAEGRQVWWIGHRPAPSGWGEPLAVEA